MRVRVPLMRIASKSWLTAGVLSLLLLQSCNLLTPGPDVRQERVGRPRAGGTISVAIAEPKSIDPHRVADRPGVLVLKQMCEPLVTADPLSSKLLPGAAESWSMSDDAKKFNFQLREGLKFHNGRDVTAEDYVYSLNRLAGNKESGSKAFLLERVAGYVEVREGRAPGLSGARALDPRTLEIETAEPFAELPAIMAHPAAGSAVPKEEVDKGADPFAANPVCTGPYRLTVPWERGKDIALMRFDAYNGKNPAFSRGGAGYAREIVFKTVPDASEGYRRLGAREVQISEVPGDKLVEARKVSKRLESGPNGILSFIGLPVKAPPFDKVEFRQALAQAIDRRSVIENVLAGSRQLPRGFLPSAAGPASESTACRDTIKSRGDGEAAKNALTASGVDPAATKMRIYFNAGGGHEAWLSVVAEQWNSVLGIESALQPDEWLKFLDFLVTGSDGPFRLAWPVEYPSAEALFAPLFSSKSLDNYSKFESQEFEEALTAARGVVDEGQRREAYGKVSEILCRDLPIIPMWNSESHIGFGPNVVSATVKRLDVWGDPILREIGLRS